jgi:hypothetical protein
MRSDDVRRVLERPGPYDSEAQAIEDSLETLIGRTYDAAGSPVDRYSSGRATLAALVRRLDAEPTTEVYLERWEEAHDGALARCLLLEASIIFRSIEARRHDTDDAEGRPLWAVTLAFDWTTNAEGDA